MDSTQVMDDDGVGASKDAQPQHSDQATSSSSSSAESESRWRPSKLVFAPYSPSLEAATKSQALRVVVRRPVSIFLFLFLGISNSISYSPFCRLHADSAIDKW